MKNKLFFTLPFDLLDVSIEQKFGNVTHIMTYTGCTFPCDNNLFIESKKVCITDNRIKVNGILISCNYFNKDYFFSVKYYNSSYEL